MREGDVHGTAAGSRRRPVGLALLVVFSVVSACGFHPRGSNIELSDAGRLFIDADRDLSIEEPLREALRDRAFVVADNRDAADIVLRVADETQSQRIVSVRSTGRVSEYELAHAVMLTISRVGDQIIEAGQAEAGQSEAERSEAGQSEGERSEVEQSEAGQSEAERSARGRAADRVRVTREYTYDEAQVLGKENEALILRAELRDELVRQIVLRTVASLVRTGAADRSSGN